MVRCAFAELFDVAGADALVASIPSLGRDALLIALCPRAFPEAYPHLAAFARHGTLRARQLSINKRAMAFSNWQWQASRDSSINSHVVDRNVPGSGSEKFATSRFASTTASVTTLTIPASSNGTPDDRLTAHTRSASTSIVPRPHPILTIMRPIELAMLFYSER
jgi:hypothetical protein